MADFKSSAVSLWAVEKQRLESSRSRWSFVAGASPFAGRLESSHGLHCRQEYQFEDHVCCVTLDEVYSCLIGHFIDLQERNHKYSLDLRYF